MFQQAIKALAEIASVDAVNIQAQRNIGQSGVLSIRKIATFMALLVSRILPLVWRSKYDLLYYCPAGPNRIGVLKDIVLLALVRRKARRVVYHFHATGSGAFILSRGAAIRWPARAIVFRPDLAIRCADVEPNDAAAYQARQERIVPNGIEDPFLDYVAKPRRFGTPSCLTFIGALISEKGIFDLVEIAGLLKHRGQAFHINVLGEGTDADVARFDRLVAERGLSQQVTRLGVVTGSAKFDILFNTTVFLFPSFFRAETQPLALIEAHAMGVPAVAYDWRGVRTIVEDGSTGFVVPLRDTTRFAERIELMLTQARVREMGVNARRRFEDRFTIPQFNAKLRESLLTSHALRDE
jgi:glycosyltransferase involved in cell wall biosynthesis